MIKINDRVEVASVMVCYNAYVEDLKLYVGKVGTVTDLNYETLGTRILFDDGKTYYYPISNIRLAGSTSTHLSVNEVKQRKYVRVCDDLSNLNLRESNHEIYRAIHGRGAVTSNFHRSSNNIPYSVFEGKTLKIDPNYTNYEHAHDYYNLNDIFTGVIYNGITYFLPICTLYDAMPTYKPKEIKKY